MYSRASRRTGEERGRPVRQHSAGGGKDVARGDRLLERAGHRRGADRGLSRAPVHSGFYGPGTSLRLDLPGGEHVEAIRGRKFPIVGSGGGIWSFVHIEDAAEATAIAVERGAPGVYNIVDDQPAAVRDWLPEAARALGGSARCGCRGGSADHGRRGGDGDDDGGPRRLEREGKARARLDASPSEPRRLARGGGLSGLGRQGLDQLAQLVRSRDRRQDRQRDPAGDELVQAARICSGLPRMNMSSISSQARLARRALGPWPPTPRTSRRWPRGGRASGRTRRTPGR